MSVEVSICTIKKLFKLYLFQEHLNQNSILCDVADTTLFIFYNSIDIETTLTCLLNRRIANLLEYVLGLSL